MNDLVTQWHDYLNASGKSPHTIRNYLSDVNQFIQCAADNGFELLEIDRAKAYLYLGFLAKKYTNHATIMRNRDAVKQFYKFLKEDGHVTRNEFEFFDRMKVPRNLPAHLSQDEAANLLDSIEANPALVDFKFMLYGRMEITRREEAEFLAVRDRAMLETIYGIGSRAQETANLNWVDIDFRAGFVRIIDGKGRRDRAVPITETAMTALWEYGKAYRDRFEMEPKGRSPVFMSRRKMRITTRSIQRVVALRLELAGIDRKMSTHGLRHSFATHLSQNGAGIVEIAECLGHASLSNTQKYVHLSLTDVIGSYDKAHPRA